MCEFFRQSRQEVEVCEGTWRTEGRDCENNADGTDGTKEKTGGV